MIAFAKILIMYFPSQFAEYWIPDFAMAEFGPMCIVKIPSRALAVSQSTAAAFAWSRIAARKARCTSRPHDLTTSCARKMRVFRGSPLSEPSQMGVVGEAGNKTLASSASAVAGMPHP